MKPFLKYCGGKSKLVAIISKNFPETFGNYFEPFLGGGSVFLNLASKGHASASASACNYYISDVNKSLMICYKVIKNNLQDLITELSKNIYINEKEAYLVNRIKFNEIKHKDNKDNNDIITECALFIYLNKCGFNGMYRENKQGNFNIPFGRMTNPNIINETHLVNVSNLLNDNSVYISSGKYTGMLEFVQKGDFVYFDPPYHETFTSYNKSGFGKNEQIELKEFIDLLTLKHVHVLLSNSCTEFIKELYKDYTIIIIDTKYSIGGKNTDRNKECLEVLIKNF